MSTISNVVIIHGCPSNVEKASNPATRDFDKDRMPRIEKKLQAKGIDVFRPLMPTPRKRVYANFKAAFDEYDTLIDEHSVIIGYSCGSAFLVHWLGENKRKVAKLILVAPRKKFLTSKSRKEEKNPDEDLYDFTINPDLAQRVGKIVMFTSNDEAPAGKESLKIYYEALGGKIIELPHHGHYTLGDMGTEAFPELVEEILL